MPEHLDPKLKWAQKFLQNKTHKKHIQNQRVLYNCFQGEDMRTGSHYIPIYALHAENLQQHTWSRVDWLGFEKEFALCHSCIIPKYA